jgi:eukaryotic-like serine/threonine-protein kinase
MSGLVTPAQLEDAIARARQASGEETAQLDIDDKTLAQQTVDMGLLTRYQADQIMSGRTKFKLGPYIMTDWIGQGGMGQVYKGIHEVMGRESAVKVLPLTKATAEAISNFTREIRTQAQLDHPNLVRAYDAGHDGNVHYLVVEYVPGTDLRRLIRTHGALPVQQAANVIMQAAKGLDHAHKRGLIHRDVKPGNILVTPDGIAKVSDLGLAGFMKDAASDPRAGKIVGTADYLAPEIIRSPGDMSAVCDIYSLGCTLYYAVCGKVPFPGGTPRDKARRHCEETPWHPRRFNPEIPEEFVEIIADMMEKNPTDRIQTAAEVVARIEPWAAETSPISSRKLSSKSPWTAPPPPDEDELGQDTDGGQENSYGESGSQFSQGTALTGSASQETIPGKPGRRNTTPLQPMVVGPDEGSDATTYIVLTLAVSVPLSMLAGAILASLVFWLFGGK